MSLGFSKIVQKNKASSGSSLHFEKDNDAAPRVVNMNRALFPRASVFSYLSQFYCALVHNL